MQCLDIQAFDAVTLVVSVLEKKATGVSLKMLRYVIDDTNNPAVHKVDMKLW
jgi:hypothetical protein